VGVDGFRVGVDFGTSSTAAVLAGPETQTRPLLFDGSPLLPSAVFAGAAGDLLTGRDAVHTARTQPERFEPTPKRCVDDDTVLLGDRAVPVVELIAAVLGRVAAEAAVVAGQPVRRAVLTHPASWGTPRRGTLLTAAATAFPEPVLVPEPVAAASYFLTVAGSRLPDGSSAMVYDLGAGTFDATVVRRTGDDFDVLATGGLGDVGGLDIDDAIVASLAEVYRGRHETAWARLVQPRTAADRRAARTFWDDVRAGKEMLSRTSTALLHIPVVDEEALLSREQLDQLARPILERTVAVVPKVLAAAGVRPAELAGLFLVGGASRMPLVGTLLHQRLGIPPILVDQPELVVAAGSVHAPIPPQPETPQAVGPPTAAPLVVAPPAVAPRAAAPQAVAPQTAPPPVVAPQAAAPQTVPPQAVAEPAVAPPAVAAPAVAARPEPLAPAMPPPEPPRVVPAEPGPIQPEPIGPGQAAATPAVTAAAVVAPASPAPVQPGQTPAKPDATPAAPALDEPAGPSSSPRRTRRIAIAAALVVLIGLVGSVVLWSEWPSTDTPTKDGALPSSTPSKAPASPTPSTPATPTPAIAQVPSNGQDPVHTVTLSADGRWLAAISTYAIQTYALPDLRRVGKQLTVGKETYRVPDSTIVYREDFEAAAFSADGKTVATYDGGMFGHVQVWDVASGRRLNRLSDSYWASCLAFSPKKNRLAVCAGHDESVRLWSVPGWGQVGKVNSDDPAAIRYVAFSPDGRLLATDGGKGNTLLWDANSRKRLAVLRTSEVPSGMVPISDPGVPVAFSPDGKVLATGGIDGTVQLWDVGTRKRVATLGTHGKRVVDLAFAPNGTLASSGADWQLRLWDVANRRQSAATVSLPGLGDGWPDVAFAPDGRALYVAVGTAVQRWDVATLTPA
jgi:hypothetical protein